ncbi:hypothetical protein, unlikely [Trypanosoma brucei gambiense DAL972]|uniref:Uncharacterized protein n=1 Tax=Trypanosoma brucei gambiense (strain MHOM/CI/86/DAL972) TaxID=679716 RepID=C9ZID6_TRYB9|nr:hypothetical protein, unlikely [Trypanosoma brucei gambiense DAL972]CBH08928.1 hypothetical protein, unlikely [Trypanosoma brucei gambiense DAL972]|eukprot:XP_011771369.1 hypothetical protein, unlikely [Trypanosoma brucei gambiense DAL972]
MRLQYPFQSKYRTVTKLEVQTPDFLLFFLCVCGVAVFFDRTARFDSVLPSVPSPTQLQKKKTTFPPFLPFTQHTHNKQTAPVTGFCPLGK